MTEQEKLTIKELRDKGFSYFEISKMTGISQDAIRNFFYRERKKETNIDDTISYLLKRIQSLERENRKLKAQHLSDEAFAKLIEVEKFHFENTKLADVKEEAGLIVSDLHSGLEYEGSDNKFNMDIAKERVQRLFNDTGEILRKYYPHVKNLHVFLAGDIVDGSGIFKGQEFSTAPITEQIEKTPSMIVEGLKLVSDFNLRLYGVAGNHGRVAKGVSQHNWDNVVYRIIEQMIDIPFEIASDFYLPVEIKGHKFILLHGDNITHSKTPSSYIERAVGEFTRMFKDMGIYFESLLMGHFHSAQWLPHAIVNGSICGNTNFTIGKLHLNEPARQVLFFVDEKHGITEVRKIQIQ